MAKIRVFVNDKQKNCMGEYTVYLYISGQDGRRFSIKTGLYAKVKFSGREFPKSEPSRQLKTSRLNTFINDVEQFCMRHEDLALHELKEALLKHLGRAPVVSATLSVRIREYAAQQKRSTARLYTLTADRVDEYAPAVRPEDIDAAWLRGFETFLRDERHLSVNGIAQKMRNIRTVLNWRIDAGDDIAYPFRGKYGYRIREQVSVPRCISAQEFADLRDYPCEPWQRVYVDLFCLSVYLAGINAGDLLLCEGLTGGRLVFVRRKTDKVNAGTITPVSLPVFPEAQAIIDRYRGKQHLLSIMDGRKDYQAFNKHWNDALKKVGRSELVPDRLGKLRKRAYYPILPHITTYTARYTFASVAANDLDISERTIGQCLGHAWTGEVTARYISHDQKRIDTAIRKVIDYLNTFHGRYH